KVSCRFCARSAAMAVFPFLLASSARDLLCPSPTACVDRMRRFAPRKKTVRGPGTTLDGRCSSGASISSAKLCQNTEITAFSLFLGTYALSHMPLPAPTRSLFFHFGVAMIVPSQCRCDEARGPIADRATVNAHYRQNDLARGGDKGFARAIGLLDRKTPFLKSETLCLDHVDNNGAGNPRKNIIGELTGNQFAVAAHDPGVRRCTLGHVTVRVDKPGLTSALLACGLFRQYIRQQRDRFDVDALPANIGHGNNRYSFRRDLLKTFTVGAARGDDERRSRIGIWKYKISSGHTAGDLHVYDAI